MMDIKVCKNTEIQDHLLDGFIRYQETKRVKLLQDGSLVEKDISFVDDWDLEKLTWINNYMKEENKVTVLVYNDGVVIGFSVLDTVMFDGYMNMPYIHIDGRYRGLGIGKKLFSKVCEVGKELGAKKLYISGHPAIETQAFYKSVGCVLAKKINEELLAIEPYDIQLEKEL
jgi:ribosomal protein S18 acetylase RimI-like enzyme